MKHYILFFIGLCLSISSSAQVFKLKIDHNRPCKISAGNGCKLGELELGYPSEDISKKVNEIIQFESLSAKFRLQSVNDDCFQTAMAYIPQSGSERWILYSEAYFQRLIAKTGTDWAVMLVLAHEIAHHLNGHTIQSNAHNSSQKNHQIEIECDRFAGKVLYWQGANLKQTQKILTALNESPTHSHPARKDRMAAITEGWKNAEQRGIPRKGCGKDTEDLTFVNNTNFILDIDVAPEVYHNPNHSSSHIKGHRGANFRFKTYQSMALPIGEYRTLTKLPPQQTYRYIVYARVLRGINTEHQELETNPISLKACGENVIHINYGKPRDTGTKSNQQYPRSSSTNQGYPKSSSTFPSQGNNKDLPKEQKKGVFWQKLGKTAVETLNGVLKENQ